jgi:zinc transport system substrate-binding protein
LPHSYLAKRVGGDRVEVDVLLLPGQSHTTYVPLPKQVARLAEADVFFRVGVTFENGLLPKIEQMMKNLLVVDTRQGLPLLKLDDHEHEEDEETEAGDRRHAPSGGGRRTDRAGQASHGESPDGQDPHTWLSPLLAKEQAKTMCSTLCRLDPDGAAVYRANYEALAADLARLHEKLQQVLAPLRGKEFFVYHAAYAYFGQAYGLTQVPVEIRGKEPSARQIAQLVARAKAQRVKVIFVQPQFSQKTARTIAEAVGAAVLPLDPLSGDYIRNLEQMADEIAKALK